MCIMSYPTKYLCEKESAALLWLYCHHNWRSVLSCLRHEVADARALAAVPRPCSSSEEPVWWIAQRHSCSVWSCCGLLLVSMSTAAHHYSAPTQSRHCPHDWVLVSLARTCAREGPACLKWLCPIFIEAALRQLNPALHCLLISLCLTPITPPPPSLCLSVSLSLTLSVSPLRSSFLLLFFFCSRRIFLFQDEILFSWKFLSFLITWQVTPSVLWRFVVIQSKRFGNHRYTTFVSRFECFIHLNFLQILVSTFVLSYKNLHFKFVLKKN